MHKCYDKYKHTSAYNLFIFLGDVGGESRYAGLGGILDK